MSNRNLETEIKCKCSNDAESKNCAENCDWSNCRGERKIVSPPPALTGKTDETLDNRINNFLNVHCDNPQAANPYLYALLDEVKTTAAFPAKEGVEKTIEDGLFFVDYNGTKLGVIPVSLCRQAISLAVAEKQKEIEELEEFYEWVAKKYDLFHYKWILKGHDVFSQRSVFHTTSELREIFRDWKAKQKQ